MHQKALFSSFPSFSGKVETPIPRSLRKRVKERTSRVDLRCNEADHHVRLPGHPARGEDQDNHHQHLDHLRNKSHCYLKTLFENLARSMSYVHCVRTKIFYTSRCSFSRIQRDRIHTLEEYSAFLASLFFSFCRTTEQTKSGREKGGEKTMQWSGNHKVIFVVQ